jgi:hypothetical protein
MGSARRHMAMKRSAEAQSWIGMAEPSVASCFVGKPPSSPCSSRFRSAIVAIYSSSGASVLPFRMSDLVA